MSDPVAAGRALGSRYRLVDRLGQGASGEVWRAWDAQAGEHVAAKLLWPQHATDPEILRRFVHERAVLLGLEHPNVVRVRDFVVEGQDLAIVMDLVEGSSLADLLAERGTLAPAVAVPLVAAVLDALGSAHARGVVHRDVKPDNVMLAGPAPAVAGPGPGAPEPDVPGPATEPDATGPVAPGAVAAPSAAPSAGAAAPPPRPEDVRLADFGIAGIVADEGAAVTELIGTPSHMPPELVSYGRCGPASDVYAAGIMLYELLAGRTPFAGPGTTVTVALRHVGAEPPALPVPDPLRRVLDVMLAKDPARRLSAPQTAAALRALPGSATPGTALPVQPQPDAWADSIEVLPSKRAVAAALGGPASGDGAATGAAGAARGAGPGAAGAGHGAPGEVPGDLDAEQADPGSTSLRPARPLGRPEPLALTALDPTDEHGATMARAAVRPEAPVLPPRPTGRTLSTRARVLVGAGAAVLLAAAGAVLWRAGVFAPDEETEVAITTVAGHVSGTTLPTGLRVDLDAAYDTSAARTGLTVTLSAVPNAPLQGDVLVVLPDLDGGGCAEVVEEDGVVAPVRASSDGLEVPCGYRLLDVGLDAGGSTEVALAVDLDLVDEDGQVPDGYRDWLAAVQQATDDALTAISGTSFPLQRVTGLDVEPTGVTLAEAATAVPYRVVATWSGGSQESTELFTDATTDGMEVELLLALTGGEGLDGVTVTACSAAQVIGIRVLAEQPESGCTLQVGAGALASREASFTIRMR
jgi:serine/threonine protein kinase